MSDEQMNLSWISFVFWREGGGGNTQWLHVFETEIMLGHAGHFISRSEVIFPVAPRSSRLGGMG